MRLTDAVTEGPVRFARVVYRPLHPNQHLDGVLPRQGSGLHCQAAEGPDGVYSGVMLPGPGAICVESFTDYYGPVSVDPVAFFLPGRTASPQVGASTVYGNTQLLAIEVGNGRGIHFLPQNQMSGILLIEPKAGDKSHDIALSLRDNRVKKDSH
jgi:hypothetical protein